MAVSESGGIYLIPLPEISLLQRHVLVKDLPHLSPCLMRSAATGMCKFRCSPSGHQAYVLRLTWRFMLARQSSRTLALAQTDLNCVLPSTRGSLKRHAVNRSFGPEVQFHRNTTLPGREKIVRRAPMQDHSLIGT
jgi:hypothetical protein